ncbi:MAG: DNA translocase FtsK 4TM domain-containing protein [Proteobacteria bacterium]|nr:DNA translocase FtsK 4TM domain-containing protein [Pseudomonadota bacterium]MBU4297511.1 DNA translocase FtsK 4TM domain-containing protein [Pseudomonadota bacterium]MCG2749729.1 DNA translocase FtsK 4TM domain-containing protein [Desulfobulbaceae bacterium]
MVKATTNHTYQPTLVQEVAAVLAIVAGLFLLLSFVSFTPPVEPYTPGASANWCGSVGNFLATLFMSFLGLSSFWLPVLFLFFGVSIFFGRFAIQRLPIICGGCTGLLMGSSALLASFCWHTMTLFGHSYPIAGRLGDILFGVTSTYFGWAGAFLFYCTIMLLSLMATVRFSPFFVGRSVVQTCGTINQKLKERKQLKAMEEKPGANGADRGRTDELSEPRLAIPQLHEPITLKNAATKEEFQPLPVQPGNFQLPSLSLLNEPDKNDVVIEREHYLAVSRTLESKLADFGVKGNVTGISPGPVITTYEFAPAPGVKINRIVSLADDLALGLQAESVRIIGSIPGKAAVGIEIPNPIRKTVTIREILATEKFIKAESKLTIGLGMDVVGRPVCADLTRMPHLLIAGATGAGKSVAINAIIASILFKATPDEVRLLMVDPKRIELSSYEAIPHLLHPVVVDPKMASRALQWAVREMERRYILMEAMRVKGFVSYNEIAEEKLPYIVIIIDELADLMMVSSNDVETSVARLAQMARAAGMHLILATQRPSVDVLTGLIKANFPTRMSFKVSSKIDSRTILDTSGAEHLLGSGDMLFLPPGTARLQRIHGAYISEQESERLIEFLKQQGSARYDESVIQSVEKEEDAPDGDSDEDFDEKYDEAVAIVCDTGQASISMVQRRLRVGYNRAARMIETMEKEGIIGPADGAKPREVLARKNY